MRTGTGELPPQFDAESFGHLIAARRSALDISQADLALAVGVSKNQIQNIESGLSDRRSQRQLNPTLTTLVGLARALRGRVIIDVTHPQGVTIEFSD